jgi:hypothetical protein
MTTAKQSVPDLLSRLINEALAPEQKNKKGKFSAFQKALADTVGVPAAEVSTVSVTDVSNTLDNRLDEWRHRTPIRVVILNTPTLDRVDAELRRARRKVASVVGQGDPPVRAVLIYVRDVAVTSTPAWTLRAMVESGDLGEHLESGYAFSRTVLRQPGVHESQVHEVSARKVAEALPRSPQDSPSIYTVEQAIADLFCSPELFMQMYDTLQRKKNIVLEGPPGVGKTFVARRLAQAIAGERGSRRVEMIQFHPSYSYEDFVRGWRPGPKGKLVSHDGMFVKFCQRARYDQDNRYVLIIDDINRGNLVKIFGELLMLMEADKRDASHAMPLAYPDPGGADQTFFVPPNVFVLGLMNTADRAPTVVDYALRRRFGFVRLVAPAFNSPTFRGHLSRCGAGAQLIDRIGSELIDLNRIIAQSPQLGPGFVIGHSYFCPAGGDVVDDTWYSSILDTQIVPLLYEYWRDDPRALSDSLQAIGKASLPY